MLGNIKWMMMMMSWKWDDFCGSHPGIWILLLFVMSSMIDGVLVLR